MPGFPKSATSWLYGCLLNAFSPSAVGCGDYASRWGADKCGRRFALTALQSDGRGQYAEKKELFYFGGVKFDRQFAFHDDLLNLHGPDPTGGQLANLPPLWPWEPRRRGLPPHVVRNRLRAMCSESSHSQACLLEDARHNCTHGGLGGRHHGSSNHCTEACHSSPRCSNLGTAACEDPHYKHFRGNCHALGSRAALPSSGCYHPACVRAAPASPQLSGQFRQCVWEDRFARDGFDVRVQGTGRGMSGYRTRDGFDIGEGAGSLRGRALAKLGLRSAAGETSGGRGGQEERARKEVFCTHSLLPWGREGELNLSVTHLKRRLQPSQSTSPTQPIHEPNPGVMTSSSHILLRSWSHMSWTRDDTR